MLVFDIVAVVNEEVIVPSTVLAGNADLCVLSACIFSSLGRFDVLLVRLVILSDLWY